MQVGMRLHRLAPPRPYSVAFTKQIPTTLSPAAGNVILHFYTPKDYNTRKKLAKPTNRFPVVINFHGGGFTLGRATDDARWATRVAELAGAVVASVDYRLAPEFPFPTAIEDGVDAILYIIRHAEELYLDPDRIAISGFSCGGNMAFTVPMRLMEEVDPEYSKIPPKGDPATGQETANVIYSNPMLDGTVDPHDDSINTIPTQGNEATHLHPTKGGLLTVSRAVESSASSSTPSLVQESPTNQHVQLPPFKIVAVVSWYPSCDYTLTRENKRETLQRKDMELSPVFTELFDNAYINPQNLDKSNPYLSPGVASEELLQHSLPDYIQIYTCEWDMLRAEALTLRDRLKDLGKQVTHEEVKGQPHGWDKSVNPFKEAIGAKQLYSNACRALSSAFHGADETQHRRSIADRLSIGGIADRLSIGGKTLTDRHEPPHDAYQGVNEPTSKKPSTAQHAQIGTGETFTLSGKSPQVDSPMAADVATSLKRINRRHQILRTG